MLRIQFLVLACLMHRSFVNPAGVRGEEAVRYADEKQMRNGNLEALIRKTDFSAILMAERLGPAAVDTARPFLEDPNRVVRLLAVNCITAAGGPAAPEQLMRALRDPDEQVRINAMNGLSKNPPSGKETEILAIWVGNKEKSPYLRQQIPLLLGRTAKANLVPDLKKRMDRSHESEVVDGFVASLARLGEAQARSRFAELLAEAHNERIAEMMEYVRYVDAPWVLPHMRPLLDRRERALVMSTHIKTVIRRGCDLAADEVMRISKAKFTFAADSLAQYKDPELREVIRYLDSLSSKPPKP